jgi:hypothetical protein
MDIHDIYPWEIHEYRLSVDKDTSLCYICEDRDIQSNVLVIRDHYPWILLPLYLIYIFQIYLLLANISHTSVIY